MLSAQTEVPFHGNFQGTDTPTPPTILQSITGNGTLVGLFSSTAVSGGPGLLTAHWIAANGDSIDTTYVRCVALKVIKLGMDTGQVLARFANERQALAMMDHPNIARTIDAGATP